MPESPGTLFGSWTGRHQELPVSDEVDAGRADLFRAFAAAPRARHDLELQLLVSGVRGSRRIPRFVLVRVGTGRWRVARMPAERGAEPTLVGGRVFEDLDDAERYVMDLRLSLLADLPDTGEETSTP